MQIQFSGRIGISDPLLGGDIRDLEVATLDSGTFLYVTTGRNGGLSAYRLGPDSTLASLHDTRYFTSADVDSVSGLLTCVPVSGAMQLIYGDNGNTGLNGIALGDSGDLDGPTSAVVLPDGPPALAALTYLQVGALDICYACDAVTGQLSGYALAADGSSTQIAQDPQAALPTLSGDVLLQSATPGTSSFLLVADEGTQGLTSYQINTTTGALSAVGHLGAADGVGINAPSCMEVVSAFGQTFVILGAHGSSSLSVMHLSTSGELTPRDHVLDTLDTRFGGLNALSTVAVDGHVFVIAGGADDGLSLFGLLPDGRLVHLQTLAHWSGAGLINIGEITAVQTGTDIQVFVSSGTDPGLSQFVIPLATLGEVIQGTAGQTQTLIGTDGDDLIVANGTGRATLSGAAGDDILVAGAGDTVLEGGAGRDIFVLSGGTQTQSILDFQVGQDLLDLSSFSFLRAPGQLTLTPTQTGAQLTFQTTTVVVTTADGRPLGLRDVFGETFHWPGRVLVLAETAGHEIHATQEGGFISGTAGNDTVHGATGQDNLWSQAGDDTLFGADGDDTLGGGEGNDALHGEDGADIVFGGHGQDTLWGGDQADQLWGGLGNDLIFGGNGDDSLGGSLDNDTIRGGAGNDLIFGDIGVDEIFGDNGDDTLWAGSQDDSGQGGQGDDTLGGGLGNDTLWGEEGADLIYGGAGHDSLSGAGHADTLYAGEGDDTLDGGSGNDVLSGGGGDDILTGGGGHDAFGFAPDQGIDQIRDFQPGIDQVHLYGVATSLAGLLFQEDAEGNAVLQLGHGQLTFVGVSPDAFTAEDFIFL